MSNPELKQITDSHARTLKNAIKHLHNLSFTSIDPHANDSNIDYKWNAIEAIEEVIKELEDKG